MRDEKEKDNEKIKYSNNNEKWNAFKWIELQMHVSGDIVKSLLEKKGGNLDQGKSSITNFTNSRYI